MTHPETGILPAHTGNDDEQHDEAPRETDALAHTEMDWNDPDQDRATSRQEARQEHRRWLDEGQDDRTPDGVRYLPGSNQR